MTSVNDSLMYQGNCNIPTWGRDTSGNVTGLVGPDGIVKLQAHPGTKAVLFGDSMTEKSNNVLVTTSQSLSGSVLTLVFGSAHGCKDGDAVYYWNRNYADLLIGRDYEATRISSTSISIDVETSDMPQGSIPGGNYGMARVYNSTMLDGWFSVVQMLSGQLFDVVYNGAQSGDTTSNAIDRLHTNCLDYAPDVVFMQIPGVNDLSASNAASNDQIYQNQVYLIDKITDSGALLVLLSMTPVYTGEARATKSLMTRLCAINKKVAAYIKSKHNVIYVDAYKHIIDTTNANGLAKSGVLSAIDYIHYAANGAYAVGNDVWTRISYLYPHARTLPDSRVDSAIDSTTTLSSCVVAGGVATGTASSHGCFNGDTVKITGGTPAFNDVAEITVVDANTITWPTATADGAVSGSPVLTYSNNLLSNPLCITATGGTITAPVTGTAAANIKCTNFAGAPTAVASVVSRSDGFGNDQQLVITSGAANDSSGIQQQYVTGLNNYVSGGRSYQFSCDLSLTNVSGANVGKLLVYVEYIIDGVTYYAYAANCSESINLTNDLQSVTVKTPWVDIPAGKTMTSLAWFARTIHTAAGTACTLKVGRLEMREKVT